jgi:hypothetical protein
MSRRVLNGLAGALLGSLLLQSTPAAFAQAPKPPQWTHAFDLKCRTSKELTFDKARAWGMEVFRDDNNGNGVYILESGSLAIARGFASVPAPIKDSKSPAWMHGLDLKVRKANEPEFTEKTQVISLEVFRDENTGNWIYITEKGFVAVAPGEKGILAPTPSPKAPVWVHGLDLKCRKGGEKAFDANTKVWSIEVFRDENTGLLIYISETGAISLAPGEGPVAGAKSKAPEWLHGLDLKCRKGGEKDFGKQTKTFGLEVFRDENNGNWIYICETGTVAVLAGNKTAKAPTPMPREPRWTHGLDLKVRRSGEVEFGPNTRVFGVEIFRDENTATVLYISEVGAIAAAAAK